MKNNKFKSVLSLLVMFSLIYCDDRKSFTYTATLRTYNKEFVNHFPKIISKGNIDETENGEYDVTRLLLQLKSSSDDFQKTYDDVKDKAEAIYLASDNCLFVINKFTTEQNYTKKRKANSKEIENYLNKGCLQDKLPVPNFWGLYDDTNTLVSLPKDFELFVLNDEKGVFWDAEHLSNGKYMPGRWKHGYSKGVAMNRESLDIIYWFVLW